MLVVVLVLDPWLRRRKETQILRHFGGEICRILEDEHEQEHEHEHDDEHEHDPLNFGI